jgi:hypothetical protein
MLSYIQSALHLNLRHKTAFLLFVISNIQGEKPVIGGILIFKTWPTIVLAKLMLLHV